TLSENGQFWRRCCGTLSATLFRPWSPIPHGEPWRLSPSRTPSTTNDDSRICPSSPTPSKMPVAPTKQSSPTCAARDPTARVLGRGPDSWQAVTEPGLASRMISRTLPGAIRFAEGLAVTALTQLLIIIMLFLCSPLCACALCRVLVGNAEPTRRQPRHKAITAKPHPACNGPATKVHPTSVTIEDHRGQWLTVSDNEYRAEGRKGVRIHVTPCKGGALP